VRSSYQIKVFAAVGAVDVGAEWECSQGFF